MNTIKLMPQECTGNYKFNGSFVMTHGFNVEFGKLSSSIAINALRKIWKERVNTPEGADYLQVCYYENVKFYVIDDIQLVTVLLPSDY